MRKFLVLFLIIGFTVLNVNAETITLTECDYTEEYLKWQALSDEEKATTVMPSMCKLASGFVGTSTDYTLSSYNLVDYDYVLGVRNQENSNSCWAFATMASIESNLLKNGYGTNYLSPAHLEFMTQSTYAISGLTTFARSFDEGGNYLISAAYLLEYLGPVEESDLEFSTVLDYLDGDTSYNLDEVNALDTFIDVDDVAIITSDQGACSSDIITTIKKYLTTYGAIGANLYFTADNYSLNATSVAGEYTITSDFLNGAYYYYNGATYNDGTNDVAANQSSNHAVTIVGWDDDIEITNFSSSNQPTSKGAWIVKNSYGTEDTSLIGLGVTMLMGDEGYYYVSYEDINICTYLAGFYNADYDVSDYVYSYDYLGWNTAFSTTSNIIYLANTFTKESSNNEVIDKITFASSEAGLNYVVYYGNSSLTDYTEIASGTTSAMGYTSVIPTDEIYLSDNYSIIVEFLYGDTVDNYFLAGMQYDDTIYEDYTITDGVSYISLDGSSWANLESSSISLQASIKVYSSVSSTSSSTGTSANTDNETVDTSNTDVEIETNDTVTNVSNTSSSSSSTDEVENPETGKFYQYSLLIILSLVFVILLIFTRKTKFYHV